LLEIADRLIAVAEFHKKIKEAFEVFDHESNNTVDVSVTITITLVPGLNCVPPESCLQCPVEEEEPTGYIRYEKFLPVMTEVLLERRYRPIPEDILLRAFEVLDPAKRGFLTKEELIKYMTEEGESARTGIKPESSWTHTRIHTTCKCVYVNLFPLGIHSA
uniref:EF-hand domain-containing protein n=1 Tax=Sus scrofa TaxID=9823 RepID=A0A8D1XMR5_PIG